MLPQISKITPYYNEWVHKPVDRPLRLFEPWYLEMCTKTPWWLVPAFWIPVISGIIYSQFHDSIENRDIFKVTYIGFFCLALKFKSHLIFIATDISANAILIGRHSNVDIIGICTTSSRFSYGSK